ncbi:MULTISPECIES: hypothetical protein [unclassified Mesorhizobium]|uniref:hypothetical protein n=1 Tax=unclassified Mesorhizobium TaxID=325217 RepID=UPI003338296F
MQGVPSILIRYVRIHSTAVADGETRLIANSATQRTFLQLLSARRADAMLKLNPEVPHGPFRGQRFSKLFVDVKAAQHDPARYKVYVEGARHYATAALGLAVAFPGYT